MNKNILNKSHISFSELSCMIRELSSKIIIDDDIETMSSCLLSDLLCNIQYSKCILCFNPIKLDIDIQQLPDRYFINNKALILRIDADHEFKIDVNDEEIDNAKYCICEKCRDYVKYRYNIVREFKNIQIKIKEENSQQLKKLKYNDFLQTDYWKIISEYKKMLSDYNCELCNSKNGLNTHHKSYENHGYEHYNLKDLIVLCHKCHSKFHDNFYYEKDVNKHEMV